MAAVDMFLKLEGIKGESRDDEHKDEIDISSYSWGAGRSISDPGESHRETSPPSFSDVSVTKVVDKATADLMLACASGKHIKEGLITCRKAGGDPVEYLKIKLSDILITAVQNIAGDVTNVRPRESINLQFAKFHVEYTQQDEKGKPQSSVQYGWDLQQQKKL